MKENLMKISNLIKSKETTMDEYIKKEYVLSIIEQSKRVAKDNESVNTTEILDMCKRLINESKNTVSPTEDEIEKAKEDMFRNLCICLSEMFGSPCNFSPKPIFTDWYNQCKNCNECNGDKYKVWQRYFKTVFPNL